MTIIEAKVQCLKSIDKYIREKAKDKRNIEQWNQLGIPEYSQESDLEYMASYNEEFCRICKLFNSLLVKEGLISPYEAS
jgi:hypothetical protein